MDSGYRREAISFQSREGLRVFGFFLTPIQGEGPYPTLLCYHGHGYGVNALVGLDQRGNPVDTLDYHNGFAIQAVRRGYAVLAIEVLGFGRRSIGDQGCSCPVLSGAGLMLGETMTGWRVYDAMRAVDYAITRPDVDADRIGTMGISGGGLVSLFHAALDERVKAAVVSGYFNEFTSCVMSINHCIDNFIPGLRLDMEMSDMAGIIAPRALWCENGDKDDIFPIDAFHRAIAKAGEIYGVLGVSDKIRGEEFKGEHSFNGAGCWDFLKRYL
jgi:hypothetical protein